MRLSTSASEGAAARALALLLGLLLLYCGVLEVAAHVGFTTSRVQQRIANARREALDLRPTTPEGAKTVLLVGNSLLLDGIDEAQLRQEVTPRYYPVVYAIENTQYFDWYYGIRRLFTEGSHPAVIIVCLSTRQLISGRTDGEYFAHYIMQKGDVLAVKESARLDMTTTSNFFFASVSAWLGSRSSVRNWLLNKMMPDIAELTTYLPQKAPVMPPADMVVKEGLDRLEALQELCALQGIRFILLVPPSLGTGDPIDELQTAAKRVDIVVMLPYRAGEMPAGYFFEDGFHLNSTGEIAFTKKLAEEVLFEDP